MKRGIKINLIGKKIGKLTIIENAGITSDRHALWACQCVCGNITKVLGTNLKRGFTKSCGKCCKKFPV